MPQKAIFHRSPLMRLKRVPLSHGQIRVRDAKLETLYARIARETEHPETWEGAFGLACLLRDHPLEEPVARVIRESVFRNAEGAFPGDWEAQIATACAALALHFFQPDRGILQRLASWCRALEANWDEVMAQRSIRVRPADLMRFLVTFYRITGLPAVLRLCERLRASAMDWTTVLQEFRQRIPIEKQYQRDELERLTAESAADETDYFARQLMINDAELLADGLRYTVFAAMFSGNGQDLTAGHNGWSAIERDHGAVCGGTTGERFLAGRGTDRKISTRVAAAWAEAFAEAMQMDHASWAADALTRLAFNALPACVSGERILSIQRVNGPEDAGPEASPAVLGRLARAWAKIYGACVMPMEDGIGIRLLLEGTYAVTFHQQMVSVQMQKEAIVIRSGCSENLPVRLYCAATETRLISSGDSQAQNGPNDTGFGRQMEMIVPAGQQRMLSFSEGSTMRVLETYHQGLCVIRGNELMVLDAREEGFGFAACGEPFSKDGKIVLPVRRADAWKERDGIPADLPVRPEGSGELQEKTLKPYVQTPCRIAVFPRERA